MKIEIHNTSVHADIIIGEDVDVDDCVNVFIGAMITEGWEVETVLDALKRKCKSYS